VIRKFTLMLASTALILAAPIAAQQTLNVRDADIRAFVQDAARVTGQTFIVDGRVTGKVSVVTDRPLSRSEYFEVFLSTLRANGLVAIPMRGGGYRIQPADGAATQPTRVGSRAATPSQFVTEVFRLRSIDATTAVETLRPLVSREGSITANRNANSLVVADYADNIRRIRELVRQIDRDSAATQIVTLDNAGAREIATALQGLAGQGGGEGGRSPVSVAAIDSSNAIALRGDPTSVARFAAMAKQLDARAQSGAEIRVYPLNNANAETLLPTIQSLIGGGNVPSSSANTQSGPVSMPSGRDEPMSAGSASNGPSSLAQGSASGQTSGSGSGEALGGRGKVVVTRYEGANSLIIAANPEMQRMLGELIRQLDTRPVQVLIEAVIVEISADAAKELGVQFMTGSESTGYFATNYSNASTSILSVAGGLYADDLTDDEDTQNSLVTNAYNSLLNSSGGLFGGAIDLGGGAVLGAIVNAVQNDTKSNLLSTPHIVTLNNQKAKLLVGQEVPVTTGEQLSDNFDNAFRTVQRQEVGTKLEVTPQVNELGDIKLFVRQEVSSIAGPVTSGSSDLIINKREIETSFTVGDGQILAIGGLLSDDERKTIESIPLLSSIPYLGELFKYRTNSRNKTNLTVFIRPTILRDRADGDRMTARRYDYVRAQQLVRNPDVEPSIDELLRDYMGAKPPVAPNVGPNDVVMGATERLERPETAGSLPPVEIPPSNAPAANGGGQ
jgi:general secretion pathway protein D